MDQRLIQESKRPSFNKLRCSPANLKQLENCCEKDRSAYSVLLPGQWNCESPLGTVIYVYRQILALGSHRGKRKSIVVIVKSSRGARAPQRTQVTQILLANTTIPGFPAIGCLNCLPKVAVALSKVLSNGCFVTSIFTGSDSLQ